jgi:sugar lactone lactonase YvrE
VTPAPSVLAHLAHCEGITVGPDGTLYTGDEFGHVYRIEPEDGSHERITTIDGWALGLCVDGDSRLYVCAYDRGSIVRIDPASGGVETYCDGLGLPNWPVFGPDGTLYVSDSGSEEAGGPAAGRVLAIAPEGGRAEALPLRPLAFANGMALASDGSLYVAESYEPRVVRVRDGQLETITELPGTVPDGLALDEAGGLIVTSYQPNRVLRLPPSGGEPEVVVEDWTGQTLMTPTNACFYGPERSRLAIAQLCAWSIVTIDVPWRGQPLFYPRLAG